MEYQFNDRGSQRFFNGTCPRTDWLLGFGVDCTGSIVGDYSEDSINQTRNRLGDCLQRIRTALDYGIASADVVGDVVDCECVDRGVCLGVHYTVGRSLHGRLGLGNGANSRKRSRASNCGNSVVVCAGNRAAVERIGLDIAGLYAESA